MPWLYLDGYTKTSKTTDGKIVLAIYRRQKDVVGLSSANNIARLGQAISRDTFPKLIDEVKLDPKIQGDLIEAMKHAVLGQIARTKLTAASEPVDIYALSPCIFTSNHQLPADPALRRRFLNYYYPKDDKPTEDEIRVFQSFLNNGLNSLGVLGDFTINYLLQHQDLITDNKNDWRAIAKIVLLEFHKTAGMDLPDWIGIISDGNQFEDAELEQEEIIRGFFQKKINEIFSRNYKSIVPWEDQKVDSSITMYKTIQSRLNFCLDNQLISFMLRKSTDSSVILIKKDVLKELRYVDISSIQYLTDLAGLLGAEYKNTKIGCKQIRALNVPVAKLIDFIEKDPSE